ncbi:galactokinase family protein [Nocardioides luteus]|nr:galactokinase family protein [Nocardioides luteus]MBG6096877.1 hypothetical protein [Nocardioides luteus]
MTDSTTGTTSESILERARVGFADHFGREPDGIWSAPAE